MKKSGWVLLFAAVIGGAAGQGETVITASTGLPDERDVVLKKAVDSIKEIPVDTAAAVVDSAGFIADEVRNTSAGIVSAVEGDLPRESVRNDLLLAVAREWNASGVVQMRTFAVADDTGSEMASGGSAGAPVIDVCSFFKGIPFPAGTSAEYWPEFKKLIVCQTPQRMLDVIEVLAVNQQQNPDYRQIEIQTKFVEVEQKTLNELGFNWDFNASWRISDNWTADLAGQTLSSTLRSAATALPGAGSAGTLTLTKDGWLPLEVAISALEQSAGADVLSAPSLTAQDGTTAEIWVGDREMMPTEFAPGYRSTSVFAEYKGWKEKNIGVYLKVTPTVADREKGLLDLKLKPEVIDLVGSDTYAITPPNASMMIHAGYPSYYTAQQGRYPIPNITGVMDEAWNVMYATLGGQDPNTYPSVSTYDYDLAAANDPGGQIANTGNRDYELSQDGPGYGYYDQRRKATYDEFGWAVPQITGSMPVFRVRKIETSLTVADGSTVGMGGLIYDKLETYKDKVPVLGSIPLLGRLFRSEGERNVKRNLMIFVTATQVDVNGRRSAEAAVR